MTPGRMGSWLAALLVCSGLWAWLNAAKNDLVARTRSVARQVQRFDPDDESAHVAFFTRLRHPEGDPDRQMMVFDGLWWALRRCSPDGAAYDGPEGRACGDDGKQYAVRRVRLPARSRDGAPGVLSVTWMRCRGSWYIQAYSFTSRA